MVDVGFVNLKILHAQFVHEKLLKMIIHLIVIVILPIVSFLMKNVSVIINIILVCHKSCFTCIDETEHGCLSCEDSLTFDNGYCLCPPGLSLVEDKRGNYCSIICGDGVSHSSENCDDGHDINGDGCSDQCEIEEGFVCLGGNEKLPDTCYCDLAVTRMSFNSNTGHIEISFDKPIALISTTNSCASLLSSEFSDRLGTDASCYISNTETSLIIFLGSNPQFPIPDVFSINSGAITLKSISCNNPLYDSFSISFPSPTADLAGQDFVMYCNDLELSAEKSKSGSELYTKVILSWELLDMFPYNFDQVSLIRQYIFNIDSLILTIPKLLIKYSAKFTFRLTVKNSFGLSAYKDINVSTDSRIKPSLEWIGPDIQEFFVHQHIIIRIMSTLKTCGYVSTPYTSRNLKFKWTLQDDDNPEKTMDSELSYLEFPPYSFSPGTNYRITVTAYIKSASEIINSTYMILNILYSPLIPFIKGGNRIVFSGQNFYIDGSDSYDSSYSIMTNQGMKYTWNCKSILETGKIELCKFLNGTFVSQAMSSSSMIKFTSNEFYIPSILNFELTIENGTRRSSSQVNITLKEAIDNNCVLSSPYILLLLKNKIKINRESKIILSAIYEGNENVYFLWKSLSADVTFLSSINELSVSAWIGKNSPENITFHLDVFADNCVSSYAEISLMVNSDPINGILSVYPKSGYALSTKFKLTANFLGDYEVNYPLQYEFFAADNSEFHNAIALSDKIADNSIETILWKSLSGQLYLRVRIYDSNMAFSEAMTEVYIYDDTNAKQYLNYLTQLSEKLDNLITSNIEFYLRDIAIISKQINLPIDEKKSFEKSRVLSILSSTNPYYSNCQISCFNSGTCSLDYTSYIYKCSCILKYAYTSNCLLSYDEYISELELRERFINSNI